MHTEGVDGPVTSRGVFFEEDQAVATAARLRADGYDAVVVREPFAGEDDDEDHPWAVVTDAPEVALELLVEAHDGWLDAEDDRVEPLPPLRLPAAPRRVRPS